MIELWDAYKHNERITLDIYMCMYMYYIKMSGSESWGKEAACTHVFRPMLPLQWVIYMGGSSKFLKFCSLQLVYYTLSTSYRMKPTAKGSIKLVQPFLRTSQSMSFGTRFCNYSQNSTFTFINT